MRTLGIYMAATLTLATTGAPGLFGEELPHGGFTGDVKPVLYVSDVRRAAPFYTDVLGFDLDGFAGDEADPYYAEMLAGRLKFGLHEPTMDGDEERVGRQRLYFRVRDLETHRQRVQAEGGSPSEIYRRSWMDYFTVRDPDGNVVAFAATVPDRHTSQPWRRTAEPAPTGDPPPDDRVLPSRTATEVLAASSPSDWRLLDPESTLVLELASGRVVIELAPAFAPRHVENIRTLVRQGYFDGLAIVRVQDDYVVQWGDPAEEPGERRSLGEAEARLSPELDRPAGGLPFTRLPDGDVYAPEVGFAQELPVARDPESGRAWLTHCYGMVGVGRGIDPDSGNGSELYVVIGHSPRHLDRNVTLVGRVVQGIEHLSTLPRGSGSLGFYDDRTGHVPIRSVRLAADLPAGELDPLEVLRTDAETFEDLVQARRYRTETWFLDPVGAVSLCNVPLPVRPAVDEPSPDDPAPGDPGRP